MGKWTFALFIYRTWRGLVDLSIPRFEDKKNWHIHTLYNFYSTNGDDDDDNYDDDNDNDDDDDETRLLSIDTRFSHESVPSRSKSCVGEGQERIIKSSRPVGFI